MVLSAKKSASQNHGDCCPLAKSIESAGTRFSAESGAGEGLLEFVQGGDERANLTDPPPRARCGRGRGVNAH